MSLDATMTSSESEGLISRDESGVAADVAHESENQPEVSPIPYGNSGGFGATNSGEAGDIRNEPKARASSSNVTKQALTTGPELDNPGDPADARTWLEIQAQATNPEA